MVLPGLIQDTYVSLRLAEYLIRRQDKRWQVYVQSPIGWVWLAQFLSHDLASEFVIRQVGQEDARPA